MKRLLMEFASHWGKKLFFPGLLDAMQCEVDMQGQWLLNLPKGEMVLWGSCFMKESVRPSAGHRRKLLPIWVELSLKFPASWKSLLDTMGL